MDNGKDNADDELLSTIRNLVSEEVAKPAPPPSPSLHPLSGEPKKPASPLVLSQMTRVDGKPTKVVGTPPKQQAPMYDEEAVRKLVREELSELLESSFDDRVRRILQQELDMVLAQRDGA